LISTTSSNFQHFFSCDILLYSQRTKVFKGFFESLKGLETIVEDITGKQLVISEEAYVDEVEVYDYIIKLK